MKIAQIERNLQGIFEILINLHNSSLITTSVTVIRSREDSNDVSIMRPVARESHEHDVQREVRVSDTRGREGNSQSFHNQLMRTSNQGQSVVVVESFTDILTESVTRSTR